jgi:hypothetical protein
MRDRIGRDVVNRGPDRRLVPDLICKRTVAAEDDHAEISHLRGCEASYTKMIAESDVRYGSILLQKSVADLREQ